MSDTNDDAKFAIEFAEACQAAYSQKGYTLPYYNVNDEVFLSRKLFTTAASGAQPSRKLGVKRYGPFKIVELVGQDTVQVRLPPNIRIHPVKHGEYTARENRRPQNISSEGPSQIHPFIDECRELIIEVDKILSHRRRDRGFQFLIPYSRAQSTRLNGNHYEILSTRMQR